MAEFKQRLRDLRKGREYTQEGLAKLLSVNKQTISQYERGVREPDLDTVAQLCDVFNVSTDYMLGRDDVTVRFVNEEQLKRIDSPDYVSIKVYGRVAAGVPMSMIEDITGEEEIPAELTKGGKEYFALTIKGDSMSPRMQEGDIVIVRKQPDAESGDVVIATVNGEDATCKRLKKTDNGIMLIPNNHNYEPMFYTNDEVKKLPIVILGVVVELRGKV